jgi:adenine/guanine phosphoribosyltransferase-like PRPP-binding protein
MAPVNKLTFLIDRFLNSAYVKDAQKGYVVVKDFNLTIDPDVLQFASRCWAEHYHYHTDIDAIVGLPDAGARLVSILAEMLRISAILPSKRSLIIPGAWEDVVSFTNASFTTNQEEIKSHIGFVKPGMKVLLVDDVIARGSTAVAAITALQQAGVEVVGLAVLFDKAWQGGKAEIKAKTGIEAFSLISIKEITQEG